MKKALVGCWLFLGMRSIVVVLGLAVGQAHATGVPVVDVAGLAQALQQFATMTEQLSALQDQVKTAAATLENAKSQLDSLKQQASTLQSMYTDFSGITGHAQMFTNPVNTLHSFLPAQLSDPSGWVKGELSGAIAQLRAQKEKFTAATLFPENVQKDAREQYQASSDYAFAYKANAQAAYNKFADRRASLESLNSAGATATTPGSKLDLIAKGNSEIALLLNDIAQMMALQLSSEADAAIIRLNADALTASQTAPK